MTNSVGWMIRVGAALAAVAVWSAQAAETAAPAPSQQSAQAQIAQQQANEKLAWDYYKPGNTIEQRLAYISPDFVNHSEEIVRFMTLNNISSARDAFRKIVETRVKLTGDPDTGTNQASSQPWKVMASGDLVTVVHIRNVPDPTRPRQIYRFHQFDLFRVKDGKFVEHWDGSPLQAPLPPYLEKPLSELTFPPQAK